MYNVDEFSIMLALLWVQLDMGMYYILSVGVVGVADVGRACILVQLS